MKLSILKLIIEDYFSAFDNLDKCRSLLPHKKKYDVKYYRTLNFTRLKYERYSYTEYSTSQEDFDTALKELFKYFEDYCKALFICLNVSYDNILPELNRKRVVNRNVDLEEIFIGTGIGAVLGIVLGIPFVGAGIGTLYSAYNSSHKDNILEASARILYENAERLKNACLCYFRNLIDNKIKSGMVDTIKEPEYALYEIKLICPLCGKKLRRVHGKYGWFMSCYGYPSCSYTAKYIPVPKINRPDIYCEDDDCCDNKNVRLTDIDDIPF